MTVARRFIFRNMFIDGRDLDITQIIFNYFSAVQHAMVQRLGHSR